jgi:hypothetical protein
VKIEISTPALLFPAVSLLFLSYTNRFLHLAALIRKLHNDWQRDGEPILRAQIENLRRRMRLIRWMQLSGALSLLLCVVAMVAITGGAAGVALVSFGSALLFMGLSLGALVYEVWISGGALGILLKAMEEPGKPASFPPRRG